ncbi:MAG: 4-hydroxy-tetrahydrodipicolinate reductase [Candidatus Fermentibacteraceae bacterium]|nr:4-hydroxy-tetrahydrodipicolinate reductase [Candidatus Fermentibacteraceae bacterium]MBN2609106.1 4-hydroxy-tetrahydrodipicolinate reductase [Candidatus Fermentibacteraceae bacterium]
MRLCVFGSEGRMGRLIRDEAGDSVVACYDRVPPGTPPEVRLPDDVDVILDFSLPSAWGDLDLLMSPSRAALVTGTTGLGPSHMEMLDRWAGERAVFASANMSRGIYVLGRLLELAGRMLSRDFSLEVVEIHHGGKVDSPSGTALKLADIWESFAGQGVRTMGRSGSVGPRKPVEIGMHSLRGGDVAGEHQLHLLGEGERLVLTHMITGRRTLALGALRAAEFLIGKEPGLYSMDDLMNGDRK